MIEHPQPPTEAQHLAMLMRARLAHVWAHRWALLASCRGVASARQEAYAHAANCAAIASTLEYAYAHPGERWLPPGYEMPRLPAGVR